MKTNSYQSIILQMMSLEKLSDIVITLIIIALFQSCDDAIVVSTPKTELVSTTVYEDDRTAKAVMDGVYSRMVGNLGYASGFANSISVKNGLASDELDANGIPDPFYNNSLISTNSDLERYFWLEPYQYIYTVNSLLEGLDVSKGVSEAVRTELQGEALFIRAFCYFYLVNDFGAVPLHLTTNYELNAKASRTVVQDVYTQIINDLKTAETLLVADYSYSSGERVRPNLWAAKALLARVYLYTQQWDLAEVTATQLIEHSNLYELLPNINQVFLKNNREAIWQLMPVRPNFNTMEGYRFIATKAPASAETITAQLLSAFESGDLRKTNWLGSVSNSSGIWYFPYKYKVRLSSSLQEYSMVFRIGEQYLIRAEARAHLSKLPQGLGDLNALRQRAGLAPSMVASGDALLLAIYKERQVELFSEWGHRWYDLKRTGLADQVLSEVKPYWEPKAKLYPIPLNEVIRNPNMSQNEGY